MQNSQLAHLMKAGMRRLASGVCVLSTRTGDEDDFAMTVSSVTSVSDNPASLLVCINKQVSQQGHLSTLGNTFAINILAAEHEDVSNLCAGRHEEKNRFSIGDWAHTPEGVPYLRDSLAVFFCRVDMASVYGTHHIVVGLIHDVLVGEERDPLLYLNSRYARLA